MNLQKYNVQSGNKDVFIGHFKRLMNITVSTITIIDTLAAPVEPVGPLPIGFVLLDGSEWYLVGWTDRRKRTHVRNLYPWRPKESILYAPWTKQSWKRFELYKCVFQRLHQLEEYPNAISSVGHWESNRQALFTCVYKLGTSAVERLKRHEIELLKHLMRNNQELFVATCANIGLKQDMNKLVKHVEEQYGRKIELVNDDELKQSGLIRLVEDEIKSKWHIKEKTFRK